MIMQKKKGLMFVSYDQLSIFWVNTSLGHYNNGMLLKAQCRIIL